MDFGTYLRARALLASVGEPLTYILAGLAILLLLAAALRAERRWPAIHTNLSLAALTLLFLGFLLLIAYHMVINRALPVLELASGAEVGRYWLPLWIEGEKLYFWALLLALLAVGVGRRYPRYAPAANAALGLLLFLAVVANNPYREALPIFHGEVTQLYEVTTLAGNPTSGVTIGIQERFAIFGRSYGKMVGYYNSSYMWIHPPLVFLAYAALAVSFLGSMAMLRSRSREADEVAYRYARLGYLALTVGILFSYPWALAAWQGQPWWWDPKINMALMMWVLYGGYLHARLFLRRRGMWRTTAILGVGSFAALVFTYLTTYVIPGIHSVA